MVGIGSHALLATVLLALLGSPVAARRKPTCTLWPSVRQRLVLVPWLSSPRQRPTRAYARLAKQLTTLLQRAPAFTLEASPVTAEELGAEGSRLRPRYWEKLRGARVLKLRTRGRKIELLLFDPDKRAPLWTWQGRVGRDGRRRLLQRLVDELLLRFTKRRGYYSTRIAFVRGRGRSSRVLVIDYDGSHLQQISPRRHEAVLPSWSPRGELTFTSYLWANPDLYIARGRRASRLSRQPGLNTGAAWSPDGKELALTLTKDGNAEIYVLDRRGRLRRRLTRHRAIDTSPTWSPDGRTIAFVSSRGGTGPQLWLMASDGSSEPRQLTTVGAYNQEPKWCPTKDCPWIAYTHQNERGIYEVRLVNAETRAAKRLTLRGRNKSPTWSPDGRWILYVSSLGGLWAVNPEGRCHHRVYGGMANTPAWSR